MSFDAIPEDKQQSFPCSECESGNIVKNKDGDWECDTCLAVFEGSFMKVSMNGLRKNLSRDIDTLREIVLLILQDEWYDKNELIEAMNDVIQDSNVLNCVYTDDPEFSDISDTAIEQIETAEADADA